VLLEPEVVDEIGVGSVHFEVANFAIFVDSHHCTTGVLDNDCPNNP